MKRDIVNKELEQHTWSTARLPFHKLLLKTCNKIHAFNFWRNTLPIFRFQIRLNLLSVIHRNYQLTAQQMAMYSSDDNDVFLVIEKIHSLYLEKYLYILAHLDCRCSKASMRHIQDAQKGFAISELRRAFGNLQVKITNFLKNCKSTSFNYFNWFSFFEH